VGEPSKVLGILRFEAQERVILDDLLPEAFATVREASRRSTDAPL